jgi:hypothetical protein
MHKLEALQIMKTKLAAIEQEHHAAKSKHEN